MGSEEKTLYISGIGEIPKNLCIAMQMNLTIFEYGIIPYIGQRV